MAKNDFRPMYGQTETVSFKVNASTAIAEGEPVSFAVATGLITTAADTCTTGIIGIAAASGAISTFIPVYVDGVFEGTASGSLNHAPGAVVYLAGSAGTAITLDDPATGSTGDVSVGVVVDTDPTAGGKVRFRLQRSRVTANTIDTPVTHA